MALNWLGSSLPLGQCLLNSKCFFLNQSASYLVCSNKNCRSALDRLRDATILPIFHNLVSFQSFTLSPHFGAASGKLVVACLFRVHIIRSRYFLWATEGSFPELPDRGTPWRKSFPSYLPHLSNKCPAEIEDRKSENITPSYFSWQNCPFCDAEMFSRTVYLWLGAAQEDALCLWPLASNDGKCEEM